MGLLPHQRGRLVWSGVAITFLSAMAWMFAAYTPFGWRGGAGHFVALDANGLTVGWLSNTARLPYGVAMYELIPDMYGLHLVRNRGWKPDFWRVHGTSNKDVRMVYVGLWIPTLTSAAVTFLIIRSGLTGPVRHCPACGYSRAGRPRRSVCPECGAAGPVR